MKKVLLSFFISFLITTSLFSQVPDYVPTDGLVGYWPFNGNANDESGNGNHGTVNGATLTTDRNGNANAAYSFDGISNFIEVINSPSINITGSQLSICFWIKFNDVCDGKIKGISKGGYDLGQGYEIVVDSRPSNCISNLAFNGGNGTAAACVFGGYAGQWHFVVSTFSSGNGQIYIDNQQQNSWTGGITPSSILSSNHNLFFGKRTPGNNYAGFLNGQLDDIAIYNRALTPEEITTLYNGTTTITGCTNSTACNYNASAIQDDGSCTFPAQTYLNCAGACLNDANNNGICDEVEATFPSYLPANGLVAWYPFNGNANDESGNGNNGTVNGATLTTDRNGNANSAYSFDGIDNRISLGNIMQDLGSPNSEVTFNIWFKTNSGYMNGSSLGTLICDYKRDGPCCEDAFLCNLIIANNPTRISYNCGEGNIDYISQSASENYLNNQWQFISITRNGSGIQKIFINGNLVDEDFYNSNFNYTPQNFPFEPDWQFGASRWNDGSYVSDYVHFFYGQLDDIAIYNRALTQDEITALYNGTTNNNSGNNNNTSNTTVPAGISYQAVARNAQGTALANTTVQVKFSLITDSLSGTTEYVETHSLSTNSLGLFSAAFGTGTPVTGTWAGINWTHSNKYLKVELDAGNGFVDLGTQQLLSSPFAIRAQSAATIENGDLPIFADNAAAIAGGLTVGKLYRTATGDLKVVY